MRPCLHWYGFEMNQFWIRSSLNGVSGCEVWGKGHQLWVTKLMRTIQILRLGQRATEQRGLCSHTTKKWSNKKSKWMTDGNALVFQTLNQEASMKGDESNLAWEWGWKPLDEDRPVASSQFSKMKEISDVTISKTNKHFDSSIYVFASHPFCVAFPIGFIVKVYKYPQVFSQRFREPACYSAFSWNKQLLDEWNILVQKMRFKTHLWEVACHLLRCRNEGWIKNLDKFIIFS